MYVYIDVTSMYIYIKLYLHQCMYVQMYTYLCIYIHVYMYTYMYIYIYIYVHVCAYIDLKEIFELFDEDGSGHIDIAELGKMMDGLGRTLSEDELKKMVCVCVCVCECVCVSVCV